MATEWPNLPLPHAPRNRPRLALLLTPIGVLLVAANVGTIFAARLITSHPALLIALDARNRHLLLVVAAGIGAVPFFLIGFLRLLAPDPFFYLLGYWYGDRGRQWLEEKSGGVPASVRWVEKGFDKARYVLVLVMPNNIVCLLAGTRRMPWKVFLALDVVGTIGRLLLIWWLGRVFEGPLTTVIDWITKYQWWIIGAFLAVTVLQATRRVQRQEREAAEHPGPGALDTPPGIDPAPDTDAAPGA